MQHKKSLFVSKTFWTNIIAGVVAVGSGQLGITIPHAPEILAAANIMLRLVTSSGVCLKEQ